MIRPKKSTLQKKKRHVAHTVLSEKKKMYMLKGYDLLLTKNKGPFYVYYIWNVMTLWECNYDIFNPASCLISIYQCLILQYHVVILRQWAPVPTLKHSVILNFTFVSQCRIETWSQSKFFKQSLTSCLQLSLIQRCSKDTRKKIFQY